MAKQKNVLTTGEVAKICNVAPRTVSKWFDSGQLRGYRIPGSKDRRIPLAQLIRFMQAHNIPLGDLDTGTVRVLILDSDPELGAALVDTLTQDDSFEAETAATAFEAGAAAVTFRPHVLLVDVSRPDVEPKTLRRSLLMHESLQAIKLIGMQDGLTESQGEGLRQFGFDGYLAKPFHKNDLARMLEEATAEVLS
ncbi:MAG: helix-turn-helix domain-containing protein [Planctomycetes bacterium]|nr:helix-turn-helix domain-containing protein [Planctomycetota bacterium]